MKTIVYVDGFNLYYGAVKDTPYKWLDINKLCQLLLPKHTIHQIKYFTARVVARPSDPDQPTRQQVYCFDAVSDPRGIELRPTESATAMLNGTPGVRTPLRTTRMT